MKEKKILFFARDFIPYVNTPGSIMRIITLANFFYSKGYKVYVITSKSNVESSYFGFECVLRKININYIEDSFKYKRRKTYSLKLILIKLKNKILSKIDDCIIPDNSIFLARRYKKKAIELIEKHGIELIYTSGPPFGILKATISIKRKYSTRVRWICEYRDSWNKSKIHAKRSRLTRYLSESVEKKVLKRIDYFVYVSPLILSKIEKDYKIKLSEKSLLAWNGYVKENVEVMEAKEFSAKDKINIGYFGSLLNSKDSYYNIAALERVVKSDPFIEDNFNFFFHSNYADTNKSTPSCFFFERILPHEESISKMLEMDYLMIVFTDEKSSDEVVTGKLFEYISVKKPIICLSPRNMEAVRIIEKYDMGIHIDITNPIKIQKCFQFIASSEGRTKEYYQDTDISIFKREVQYNKILEVISQLP